LIGDNSTMFSFTKIMSTEPTFDTAARSESKNDLARLRSATAQRKRGVDLISDALPFRHLWYSEPNAVSNAIVGYASFYSR
jgi:hypothetical protein